MNSYLYVKVRFDGSDRAYSYICEIDGVEVGTKVKVPVGADNRPKTATVTEMSEHTAETAPFPPDRCKRIIEIVTEEPKKSE